MPGLIANESVHLLADPAIVRMAALDRAQLQQMHRLAGVHLHVVPDAIREGHGVLGHIGSAGGVDCIHKSCGLAEGGVPLALHSGVSDLVGGDVAVGNPQPLPVDCHQTMALQVSENAEVGEQVEAVIGSLESASRPVAAIRALPYQTPEHDGSIFFAHTTSGFQQLLVRQV